MSQIDAYYTFLNRKPDFNFNHDFKGFGIHISQCNVKIWESGGKCFVLFTDLGKGTSVTNAAEQLVEEIYHEHLADQYSKDDCIFAETYQVDRIEDIDLVIPEWKDDKVVDVDWKHLGTLKRESA